MSDLIYARASDNVAALVTPSAFSGTTINANFPLTRIIDKDPATATKSTTTGDFRIVYDYTTDQRVDYVWLPMYNAPAGNIPRFEGNATNVWTAPTVSRTATVPAYRKDLPVGLIFDITAAANYITTGFRYWSLIIPNPSQVTAIGDPFISSRKRTTKNLLVGPERIRDRRKVLHPRADGGYFRYDRGTDIWSVRGRVIPTVDQEYEDYQSLWDDVSAGDPFAIVLESHLAAPEGLVVQWFGGFRQVNLSGRRSSSINYPLETFDFTWQMVPRGRAL